MLSTKKIFKNYKSIVGIDIEHTHPLSINCLIVVLFLTLATLCALLFRELGFHETNIILSYILGVLFIAKYSDGYIYGVVASIISVLVFNFLFTVPLYTLSAYRPDYPVTFAIMLFTSVITSTLTSRIKKEALTSSIREQRIRLQHQLSVNLLKSKTKGQAIEIASKIIHEMFSRNIIIRLYNREEQIEYLTLEPDIPNNPFNLSDEINAALLAFHSKKMVYQPDLYGYYQPIFGQNKAFGVIGIAYNDSTALSTDDKILLKALAAQLALTLEREDFFLIQKKAKFDIEKEKLRSNVLRSISHDLRTPLTAILGSTSVLLDNDNLPAPLKNELCTNIYEDTSSLIRSVENILSMTKMDDGFFEISKKPELIEELISGALDKVKRILKNREIFVKIPDNAIMIHVDGLLIQQVLFNLLDNAVKYTNESATIWISSYIKGNRIIFEVADNGSGIPEKELHSIFMRFYTGEKDSNVEKRGTGLGLAICKSIVAAHGGEIKAFNNQYGGATLWFSLPLI